MYDFQYTRENVPSYMYAQQKLKLACASAQWMYSLIRVFVACTKKLCILGYSKCVQWRIGSDCAGWLEYWQVAHFLRYIFWHYGWCSQITRDSRIEWDPEIWELTWRDEDHQIINCLFYSGFNSLFTIFQSYCDGVWMWQGAQCSLLECCLTEKSLKEQLVPFFKSLVWLGWGSNPQPRGHKADR